MKGGVMERPDVAWRRKHPGLCSEENMIGLLDYIDLLEDAVREAIAYRGLMRTTWDLDRPLDEALARLPAIPPKGVGR